LSSSFLQEFMAGVTNMFLKDALAQSLQKLDTPDDRETASGIMNLILVWEGARPGFLIESFNFSQDERKARATELLDIATRAGLAYRVESEERMRIFVGRAPLPPNFKTEMDLGVALGFQCAGHDYSNQEIDRRSIIYTEQTTNLNLITEVCEADKPFDKREPKRRARRFTTALLPYFEAAHVTTSIAFIPSRQTRVDVVLQGEEKLILQEREAVADDLWNNFADCRLVEFLKSEQEEQKPESPVWKQALRMIYAGWVTPPPTKWSASYLQRYRRDQRAMQQRMCEFEAALLTLLEQYQDILPDTPEEPATADFLGLVSQYRRHY
jgi:hypothetical protein